MKKKIRIKFIGFYKEFDMESFFIYQILKKHFDVELCDDPDYVVYSCFDLLEATGEEHLQYNDCVKIYYTGENLVPDFNLCDYAIGFEYMEYGDRYLRYPCGYPKDANHPGLLHHELRKPEEEHRPGFCSFVYSNMVTDPMREKLYQAINHYKPVDGAGKVHHTVDIPHAAGGSWAQERIDFEKNYKFSIACENSAHPGYTTEKILLAFSAGAIPIYWGDPLIKRVFNEKAFICVYDYDTLDDLVRRVKEIDTDPDLYREMATQPVFVPGNEPQKMDAAAEEFLVHIFAQPKEQAYRRNRVVWGNNYVRHYQQQKMLYDQVTRLEKLYHSTLKYQIRHYGGKMIRKLRKLGK